jgi:hypothetical protein
LALRNEGNCGLLKQFQWSLEVGEGHKARNQSYRVEDIVLTLKMEEEKIRDFPLK